MSQPTIRALSFRASGAIKAWCTRHELSNNSVDAFCEGLCGLATAPDILGWNERMNLLELTGLGDPVPDSLAKTVGPDLGRFDEMIQSAREISASQIFGAENRDEIQKFFQRT